MGTYRERRQARAERLREWSGGNAAKSDAGYASAKQIADMIPMGQPILVGHHSEKRHRRDIARIDAGMRQSVELGRKAQRQAQAADEIERQAAGAIYSDDADAVERLEEKIAGLEEERDRIKRYNASCRKAAKAGETIGDLSILTEAEKDDLLTTARVASYMIGKGGAMPSYKLTNLSGNISRSKQRLVMLKREREHGPRDRIICARFASDCASCGARLEKGDTIRYNRQAGARCHPGCQNEGGA